LTSPEQNDYFSAVNLDNHHDDRSLMSELPEVLQVKDLGDGRWAVPHPGSDPEGRDVVFSGQVLAQMIMVSDAVVDGQKEVKSVHAIFARAGRYSAGPMELVVEPMHSGRAWASNTITAVQGGQLLSRGLVLLNTVEPDLMRHGPVMPDVPGPEECAPTSFGVVYPDAEARLVDRPDAVTDDGSPVMYVWVRAPESYQSVAANQAIEVWSEPGLIIGTAMRPHSDTINIGDAHRSISTGVISHTAHFHQHGDAGEWLLFAHEGAYAGNGRVFGRGAVFTRDGALVSTFAQDSMARAVEGPLDFKRAM
jgi:acyl-CoA thioesterase II